MGDYKEPKLKKATLKGRQLTVTYCEYRPEGDTDVTKKCEMPAHKDLTEAFKKLIPHVMLLTEMRESEQLRVQASLSKGIDKIKEEEFDFTNCEVLAVKLDKSDTGCDAITISGNRYLSRGGTISMSTASQELERKDEEGEYEFIDELALAVEAVKFEVNEYLFNEKYAANQQSIDFEVGADAPFPGCEEEVGRIVDNDTGEVTPINGKRKSKVA